MTDLRLDPATHDLAIQDGDLVLIDTEEYLCEQSVKVILKAFTGEFFLHADFGVPWLESEEGSNPLLGKSSQSYVDSKIRGAILSSPHVLEITRYDSTFNAADGARELTVEVLSGSGPITITDIRLPV